MVQKGPWWVGSGTKRDPERTVPMPAGSFVTHVGKQVHWDGTKDDESSILIIGQGPASNIEVPEVGPSTALDAAAVTYTLPEQIKWRDPSNAAPMNTATLHGDPSKPGFYVNLNRYKPGAFSRPHFHPNDGFVTVLKGTLWVGTGTRFDTNSMLAMPTGTFMQHFGKQVHFQGAKDEEAMILVAGEGPATATSAEDK
jgi:quercetin dioxygenase-like cupin family protein